MAMDQTKVILNEKAGYGQSESLSRVHEGRDGDMGAWMVVSCKEIRSSINQSSH